eukprot:PhF_6_TR29061/c1_g1_i2/m.42348
MLPVKGASGSEDDPSHLSVPLPQLLLQHYDKLNIAEGEASEVVSDVLHEALVAMFRDGVKVSGRLAFLDAVFGLNAQQRDKNKGSNGIYVDVRGVGKDGMTLLERCQLHNDVECQDRVQRFLEIGEHN